MHCQVFLSFHFPSLLSSDALILFYFIYFHWQAETEWERQRSLLFHSPDATTAGADPAKARSWKLNPNLSDASQGLGPSPLTPRVRTGKKLYRSRGARTPAAHSMRDAGILALLTCCAAGRPHAARRTAGGCLCLPIQELHPRLSCQSNGFRYRPCGFYRTLLELTASSSSVSSLNLRMSSSAWWIFILSQKLYLCLKNSIRLIGLLARTNGRCFKIQRRQTGGMKIPEVVERTRCLPKHAWRGLLTSVGFTDGIRILQITLEG